MTEAEMNRDHILRRLLGPAGEQLTCEQCFDHLDEYVDLELSGRDADAEIPGMSAHLEGCQACGEDHESLRDYVAAWTRDCS